MHLHRKEILPVSPLIVSIHKAVYSKQTTQIIIIQKISQTVAATGFPKEGARFLKLKNIHDLLIRERKVKLCEISTLYIYQQSGVCYGKPCS